MHTEHQPRPELSMSHRRVTRPCSGGTCSLVGKVTVSSTAGEEGEGTHGDARAKLVHCGNTEGRAQGRLRSSGEAPREGRAWLDPQRMVKAAKGQEGTVPSSRNSVGKAAREVETGRVVETATRRGGRADIRGGIFHSRVSRGLCLTALRT